MDAILRKLEEISHWNDYEEVVPYLKDIINTEDFKSFPKLKNQYYIEALSYYALGNWEKLPSHAKALIFSRYPIFINKLAYGKTIEEYNKAKSEYILSYLIWDYPFAQF